MSVLGFYFPPRVFFGSGRKHISERLTVTAFSTGIEVTIYNTMSPISLNVRTSLGSKNIDLFFILTYLGTTFSSTFALFVILGLEQFRKKA